MMGKGLLAMPALLRATFEGVKGGECPSTVENTHRCEQACTRMQARSGVHASAAQGKGNKEGRPGACQAVGMCRITGEGHCVRARVCMWCTPQVVAGASLPPSQQSHLVGLRHAITLQRACRCVGCPLLASRTHIQRAMRYTSAVLTALTLECFKCTAFTCVPRTGQETSACKIPHQSQ